MENEFLTFFLPKHRGGAASPASRCRTLLSLDRENKKRGTSPCPFKAENPSFTD